MLLQSVASVRNRETRCLSVVREKVDACRNRVRNRAVQLPGSGNRANLSRPSEAQRRKMSKMASSLNEASLEKKLSAVTNTQESIQTLSLWCIHHRAHHKKIVDVWMKVLRKAKSSHRLALLYVANDVIQNSKRKSNSSFADSWANVLKDVMPLVRDEKIISQVERILTVWEERNVYESEFVDNIRNALTTAKTRASIDTKLLTEFKSQKVIDKIKRLLKVQSDSELKYGQLTSMKIDVSSTETLRQLKDRANGDKFSKEFEDATAKMGEYIQTLEKEVSDRASVVELLEKAEKFYDNQRGEAKIVANAYKNFASRVKNLKRKLSEMKNGLPSPVPSPTTDAPSPVDSDSDVAADASKDNTEAVDMEMSDEEVGGRPNAMTSLIDSMSGAMSSRKGSLESRLSNFMQNMSNFSPAIDSSLFDDQHPATPPTRGSCHASRLISPCNDGGGTPLKDEGSIAGSTTPLQDEEFEATKASRSSNSWANVQRMDNKLSVSDVIKQIGFQTGAAKPAPPPPSWNSKVPLPPLYSNSPNSWQQQDQFSAPAPLVEDMSMEQTDPYMYVQPEPAKPLPEMYGSYGAANNYSRNPNIVELTPSPTHEAMAMGESGRIHSNLITVVQNNNNNNMNMNNNNSSVAAQEQIRFTLKGKQAPLTPSRVFGTNNVRQIIPTTDGSNGGGGGGGGGGGEKKSGQEKNGGEGEEPISRIETIGLYNRRDDGFSMISPPAAPRAFNWQQQQQPPPSVAPFEPTQFFPQQRFPYGPPPPKRFPRPPRFESRRPPYPPRF